MKHFARISVALRHAPRACELMDDNILEVHEDESRAEQKSLFSCREIPAPFWPWNSPPAPVSEVHFCRRASESELREAGLGYHYPVVWGGNQNRVWNLRKAALGLLANIPGDAKPVAVIEDTAIDPEGYARICARVRRDTRSATISPRCTTVTRLQENCTSAQS